MQKSEDELLKICLEDVTKVLGVKKEPYMVQCFKVMKAIPQYHTGHREKVAKIEEITSKLGNIYIGGNVLYGIGFAYYIFQVLYHSQKLITYQVY